MLKFVWILNTFLFKLDTIISLFIPKYVLKCYQLCSVELLAILRVLEVSFKKHLNWESMHEKLGLP